MEDIRVRFAGSNDLEFVRQHSFFPAEVIARKIDLSEVIITELDSQPVGCLVLEYLWSAVPYIAFVTVRPPFRRRGAGKAMLSFVSVFLVDRGYKWLYSSSQANEPEPQAWHRHMGFQDCGAIAGINDGGISEIFFRKKLA